MRTFATQRLEAVQGKQIFEKLFVNDVCLIDEFKKQISEGDQYFSEFKTIISYMDLFAKGSSLPQKKFREIKGGKLNVKQYEFKSKSLRVYVFSILGGKMIVMEGYKKNQKSDIRTFQSIVKDFISSTNL
ncbi:MAG: hypothetical protein EOL95_08580 [Bacteroidia bacterium]|nr:hypothetical protein [Bacteroidia bacterium]